ncbi:MAG TPA: hypothetical protein VMY78_03085 [Solirubrobacteraceae bacterium]|nr:hypothetical protein [Solirubrobacteraceae bacterium]
MSDESNEQSAKGIEKELSDEADRMERRLEELDDHVDEAKQKADAMREPTPDVDVPVGDEDTEDKVPAPAQEP